MHNPIQNINNLIASAKNSGFSAKEVTDGYHTFQELYDFRLMYNAALFNEWASHTSIAEGYGQAVFSMPKYDVHKSLKHNDGELCFGGGWFIVSAKLPTGLISNHYKMEHWDLFKVPEVEKAKYKFDGHKGKDVLERIKDIL